MMTNKRFPEFDIRQAGTMDQITILVECYVRVKRKNKYWRVLVSNNFTYIHYTQQFQQFALDLQRFHTQCKMTELFFQMPGENARKFLISKGSLQECNSHLSNKEEDILRYGKAI
jgi:hypothetical protein